MADDYDPIDDLLLAAGDLFGFGGEVRQAAALRLEALADDLEAGRVVLFSVGET